MPEPNHVVEDDCFRVLALMDDRSVDLVLTDPPRPDALYPWSGDYLDTYAALYLACKKARSYVVFFWNPQRAPSPPNGWFEIARHIWYESASNLTSYEVILVWAREPERKLSRVFTMALLEPAVPGKWPTQQKPLTLLTALLDLYSKAGNTILDPFAARGTILLACLRGERLCVAIEHNAEFAKLARAAADDFLTNISGTPPSFPSANPMYSPQRPLTRPHRKRHA